MLWYPQKPNRYHGYFNVESDTDYESEDTEIWSESDSDQDDDDIIEDFGHDQSPSQPNFSQCSAEDRNATAGWLDFRSAYRQNIIFLILLLICFFFCDWTVFLVHETPG